MCSSFYDSSITIISKLDRHGIKKRPISLINKDPNKTLANKTHQCFKIIKIANQISSILKQTGLLQDCNGISTNDLERC